MITKIASIDVVASVDANGVAKPAVRCEAEGINYDYRYSIAAAWELVHRTVSAIYECEAINNISQRSEISKMQQISLERVREMLQEAPDGGSLDSAYESRVDCRPARRW